jgi:hypothetical protein
MVLKMSHLFGSAGESRRVLREATRPETVFYSPPFGLSAAIVDFHSDT